MRNEETNQNINHQTEREPANAFYQRCAGRLLSAGLLSEYFINGRARRVQTDRRMGELSPDPLKSCFSIRKYP